MAGTMRTVSRIQPKATPASIGRAGLIGNSNARPVVQRKRDAAAVLKTDPNSDVEEAERDYTASLESGLKLRDKGLIWYQQGEGATKPIDTETTNTSIEAAGYKTFWTVDGSKFELVTERGDRVEGQESRQLSGFGDVFEDFEDLGTDVMYGNSFDAATGAFTAEGNWGNWDDDFNKKLGARAKNSEIIWHQQALARSKYAQSVGGPGPTLDSITRSAINNDPTLHTLLFCDGWPGVKGVCQVTLESPFSDDVWALLGSPNGNSSVHLLMQHGEEFDGLDIRSVVYEVANEGAAPSMTINFVKQ